MTEPAGTPKNTPVPDVDKDDAPRARTAPTPPSSGSSGSGTAPSDNDLPLGTVPISGDEPTTTGTTTGSPTTPGQSKPGQSKQGQGKQGQSSSGQGSSGQDKSEQAKGAAEDVAGDAKDAGQAVKDTAAKEAAEVKDDAVREAKRLGDEAGTMLQSQAADQLDRAAGTVRTFSDDLGRLARGEKPEPGVAQDLLEQLGSRADATATWLEHHDPKEVLQEVQSFARRRPVAFLAIAAGVGFAAGRLTRGVQQNHTDDTGAAASQHRPGSPAQGGPAYGGAAGAPPAGSGGVAGTAPAGPAGAPVSGAPVSGNQSAGAPAYETGPSSPTPGYTGGTDPYPGGERR